MGEMKLSQLCTALDTVGLTGCLEGEDRIVRGVNTLDDATDGEISFLSNPKYLRTLEKTKASAVIVGDAVAVPPNLSAIRSSDPYAAITVAIIAIHGHRMHPKWGVNKAASIDSSAKIGSNANIAGGATIGADVCVGDNCTIYPGCYVADRVVIGQDVTLYPNVVIYDDCILGDRVTIHAGSVIGEDGLGYAPRDGKWMKIPQVGRAVLGDDVELGANCTIDRATLGRTEIGPGTKFGNVVVIGHGTKIGPDCMFVGQIGIAGSVTVGRHVTMAGQVGVAGHLTIGDDVRIGAQSGISGSVPAGAEVLGAPAIPIEKAKRSLLAMQKLPEWAKRLKELERMVADLQQRLDDREPR